MLYEGLEEYFLFENDVYILYSRWFLGTNLIPCI